jgi:ssDNA-binding Zn-finger/Zn-ribbon topoisomerase 1
MNHKKDLVHVSEVPSGKKCDCSCPVCGTALIAAKGEKKVHHFKHSTKVACDDSLESTIHLAAKKIIKEKHYINLPECSVEVSARDSSGRGHTEKQIITHNGSTVEFDTVSDEISIHDIKADILAKKQNTELIIEVCYRHKVDDIKLLKLIDIGISAIEIDLSFIQEIDLEDWKSFWKYVSNPNNAKWLYNAKAEKERPRLQKQLQRKIIQIDEKLIIKRKKEKNDFKKAILDVEKLLSTPHLNRLKEEAQKHPTWQYSQKYAPFSWENVPDFLNFKETGTDWIYGCDRRIWQINFFTYFVLKQGVGTDFCTSNIDEWLQSTVGCKVPLCLKTCMKYKRKYPELLDDKIGREIVSSWKTLNAFFYNLCEIGILKFMGREKGVRGSCWYRVNSEQPTYK